MTDDIMKMRSKAASYAQSFLANKYYEEYKELYDAYLINRGVTIRRGRVIKDERLINNES
jgi:uncharacterized protein (UPF0305 family)